MSNIGQGNDGLSSRSLTAADFYTPAMMQYDGTSGYYEGTYTSSGNKVTLVARFKIPTFTGGASQNICALKNAGGDTLGNLYVVSSDHPTTTRRNKLAMTCSNIGSAFSGPDFADDTVHTVVAGMDGDAGTAFMIVDGVDVLDTGNPEHSIIVGSRPVGAGSNIYVGCYGTPLILLWSGQVGFVGGIEAYLTNWSDFMQTGGTPKPLDEATWTEWGAQPLFWNEHGDMENNLGSAGAMTRNGTIVVGKGGN